MRHQVSKRQGGTCHIDAQGLTVVDNRDNSLPKIYTELGSGKTYTGLKVNNIADFPTEVCTNFERWFVSFPSRKNDKNQGRKKETILQSHIRFVIYFIVSTLGDVDCRHVS